MSSKRLQQLFGLTDLPFSPDARYITAPAVVPASMAEFFEVLHGVVAYQHPLVFLVEARIGAGKTTIFSNIIEAINQNKVAQFVKKNKLQVKSTILGDFEANQGIAFRVEMSADIANRPEEYVQKLYTAIDMTLHDVNKEKSQSFMKKKKEKLSELEPRLHDSESKLIFPLVETIYLLLDKEGAGFDYITVVLDEFDTIITEDPKKVDAFLDFIVRKFVEKLKEKKPHWATSNPKVCLVLLCTRFRSDQVRAQLERIGGGAVPRTFYPGPRLGYSREEFHEIVKRRLEDFRPKKWLGDKFSPFTRPLLDKAYDAFYDKAAECLTNMGLAEQTLYEILTRWDAASKIDEKIAITIIEDMRRVYVTTETVTDLAIEAEVSRITSATGEVDERISYVLDGFLSTLKQYKVTPSEEAVKEWLSKVIEKENRYAWFCKPYDVEYQGKNRKIYIMVVEFLRTPTDEDVEDILDDLTKRFLSKRKEVTAPQGLIILYRSSANKDSTFQEKFQDECERYFNRINPVQLDESVIKNLIKMQIAIKKDNMSVQSVASGELAKLAYDIQNFLQNINDLVPIQPFKFSDEKKHVYVGLLLASYLEGKNDEDTICKCCNRVFKDILMERDVAYKTVGKIMSSLISDGFAEEIESGSWRPLTPFTIRYFFDFYGINSSTRTEETIGNVFGLRFTRIEYLFDIKNDERAYDLLRIKDGKVELVTRSEASVDFRNFRERVVKLAIKTFGKQKVNVPTLQFATDLEKVASSVQDEFQSALLMRYACRIIENGILSKVKDLEESLAELQKRKVPKQIFTIRKSDVDKATEAILVQKPEIANQKYISAYDNLAQLLEEEGEEEAKPSGWKPSEEEERVVEEEPTRLEEIPAVEVEEIMSVVSKRPCSLSDLSVELKASKDVVFDKVDPLIRNDKVLLTISKVGKRRTRQRKAGKKRR